MKNGQTTPLAAVVEKISMSLIDPFSNHPFYVFDDNEMIELIESIRKNGLITPIIVRRKGNRYELISGHRRKRAYEYLGYAEIACSVINASDDEAVIMMVDSNCQRTKLLPSERAFAYKMKLDAMKRQGRRTDLTSAQLAQKSANKTSRQILAEQEGQSQNQIRRYIRLINLVSECPVSGSQVQPMAVTTSLRPILSAIAFAFSFSPGGHARFSEPASLLGKSMRLLSDTSFLLPDSLMKKRIPDRSDWMVLGE